MGWMPDGPHALLDPFPVMAVSAASTERIQLGTAVTDPMRRHPAQLAQSALTLQQLSGGRLVLGVGCGEIAGTRPYGIPYDKPVSKLTEALEVMRKLWNDGESVTWSGKFYELDRALCGLAASVDAPPVWIAAHGPRTLRLTGAVADGWLPTAAGVVSYGEQLGRIREAEREAGREGAVEPAAFIWLVAAESKERAREMLDVIDLRALGLLLPQGALATTPLPDGPWADLLPTDPQMLDLAAKIDPDELAEAVPTGSPEEIADAVVGYVEAGCRHLVLCDMSPVAGVDNGLGMRPTEAHSAIRDRVIRRIQHT